MNYQTDTTYIIYAGGTFGCHGEPLAALSADKFLPPFKKVLAQHHVVEVLPNDIIKDSSTLNPADFVHFYKLIKTACEQGARRFVLITGTDTLAYLSAFLSVSLQGLPLSLVATGSMLPLFMPTISPLVLDVDSDAYQNCHQALMFVKQDIHGVFVSFFGQIFYADGVQKIHTSDKNTFVGQVYSPTDTVTPKKAWQTFLNEQCLADGSANIQVLYCVPNWADNLATQLTNLIHQTPSAVILLGFGAGNMPQSQNLVSAIQALIERGFLLIMASSCPFGAVSDTYAAGAWQYELGVVSAQDRRLPQIFAHALWLCLTVSVGERQKAWQESFV